MNSNVKYVKLSWQHITNHCKLIVEKMKDFKPDVLISLGRGGMIPTRILSDMINVKTVHLLNIKLYKGVNIRDSKPTVENFNVIIEKKNVLLIDDIVDTGLTIDAAISKIYECRPSIIKTATLLCKKQVKRRPTYIGTECEDNEWIIFPWEKEEFKKESI